MTDLEIWFGVDIEGRNIVTDTNHPIVITAYFRDYAYKDPKYTFLRYEHQGGPPIPSRILTPWHFKPGRLVETNYIDPSCRRYDAYHSSARYVYVRPSKIKFNLELDDG